MQASSIQCLNCHLSHLHWEHVAVGESTAPCMSSMLIKLSYCNLCPVGTRTASCEKQKKVPLCQVISQGKLTGSSNALQKQLSVCRHSLPLLKHIQLQPNQGSMRNSRAICRPMLLSQQGFFPILQSSTSQVCTANLGSAPLSPDVVTGHSNVEETWSDCRQRL